MKVLKSFFVLVLVFLFQVPAQSFEVDINNIQPRPHLTADQYELLKEIYEDHMNFFLSSDVIMESGLPKTAFSRVRTPPYNWSNPTEWGYAMQAWLSAAERGIITRQEAADRLETALNTLIDLQNTEGQHYQKLFYPAYRVADENGRSKPVPHKDGVNFDIPSIDDGFLYTSLIIIEGWAKTHGFLMVEEKAKSIYSLMDFRVFFREDRRNISLAVDARSDHLNRFNWSFLADEGGMMLWIAYLSDSITFKEFQRVVNNLQVGPRSYAGITVEEATFFNAMFTWSVRVLSGFPISEWETNSNNEYSKKSLVPNTRAHIQFALDQSFDYPCFTDAMTQVGGTGIFYPPNLQGAISLDRINFCSPHAMFIPLMTGPDMDSETRNTLIGKIDELKHDSGLYYHNGGDEHHPFGFEVTTSLMKDQIDFPGLESRLIFETLNHSYIMLSIDHALNVHDGKPTFLHYASQIPAYNEKLKRVLEFYYPEEEEELEGIRVPEDHATIQAAINAASPGDNILVAPGEYRENLVVNKSGISLIGHNKVSSLVGDRQNPVITCTQGEGEGPIVIKGFTIRNGLTGIDCKDITDGLIIENNKIIENLDSENGTGVELTNISNIQILDNIVSLSGDCINVEESNDIVIKDNLIESCRDSGGDGLRLSESKNIRIENNDIINTWDGALVLSSCEQSQILKNRFLKVEAWDSISGIFVGQSIDTVIKNNVLTNTEIHMGTSYAPFVYVAGSNVEILNNTFNDGKITRRAFSSAIRIFNDDEKVNIRNNIFSNIGNERAEFDYVIRANNDAVNIEVQHNLIFNDSSVGIFDNGELDETNILEDPLYIDEVDFLLAQGSPAIDAGDPSEAFNDDDGTRNDIGATGGPGRQEGSVGPELADIPDQSITNDSISIYLDKYVHDADDLFKKLTWTVHGADNIDVSIDEQRVATISRKNNFAGSETITFRVRDPFGHVAEDQVTIDVSAGPIASDLISPIDGSTLDSTIIDFQWTKGSQVVRNVVGLGTGRFRTDIGSKWLVNGETSVSISGVPLDGKPLHVTLWSTFEDGSLQANTYEYGRTERDVLLTATLASPTPGSDLSAEETFVWNPAEGAVQYWVYIGRKDGSSNLRSIDPGSATSVTVSDLPQNGEPIWLRIYTLQGTGWTFNDYEFGTLDLGIDNNPEAAEMVSPAVGERVNLGDIELQWSEGNKVWYYWLFVGTRRGGSDLLSEYQARRTNKSFDEEIPDDQEVLYVTLWTRFTDGSWANKFYDFRINRP